MRYSLLMILALPLAAAAQNYSTAPIIVDTSSPAAPAAAEAPLAPGALPPNFPEAAITRVGENSTGQHVDSPDSPPSPTAPVAPDAPTSNAPANPASPTPPPSPINKLWPRNTVTVFLPSCTTYHTELVSPCTCIITRLMAEMPHDEFLRLSEAGTIEQDARLITIRQQCLGTPDRRL